MKTFYIFNGDKIEPVTIPCPFKIRFSWYYKLNKRWLLDEGDLTTQSFEISRYDAIKFVNKRVLLRYDSDKWYDTTFHLESIIHESDGAVTIEELFNRMCHCLRCPSDPYIDLT